MKNIEITSEIWNSKKLINHRKKIKGNCDMKGNGNILIEEDR